MAATQSGVADPPKARSALDKTIEKLHKSISDGSFYEAQQMFKTVYARYRNKKAYDDSYTLAEEGARLQLTKGQLTCGVELAMLLAESYLEDKAAPTQANLDRILSVHLAFPEPPMTPGGRNAPTGEAWPVQECVRFLMAAVKWLARCKGAPDQIEYLHGKAADYIWRCQGPLALGWATIHYVRASNRESFAAALIACAECGQPEEEDLFIARAILQTLAVATPESAERRQRQLEGCSAIMSALYMFRGGVPLTATPLMNFITFLLKALKRENREAAAELEQMLHAKYLPVLQRDPELLPLLSRVEQVYLGIQPPARGGMAGLLGDMMKSLMAGDL